MDGVGNRSAAGGMVEPRQRIADLSTSAWAFAVVASAAETGLLVHLTEPRSVAELAAHTGVDGALVARMLDVLATLGLVEQDGDCYVAAPGLQPMLVAPMHDVFLAELRTTYLQSGEAIQSARQGRFAAGWHHTDPELLRAQGRSGQLMMRMIAQQLFPRLGDLQARLQAPTATFLDVGAGVGVLTIELCRLYPHLHAVALEPSDAPRAEARANIAAAGLDDRIEVRSQRVEELTDRERFDLAFLPQVFMPADVVRRGLDRIFQALRPGGWVMAPVLSTAGDTLEASLARLRNVWWGGDLIDIGQMGEMVRAAGFLTPGPSGDSGIAGQRPG